MQHVGGHYNTGNTTAFHSMHFTPAAENTTTNVSSGPTTTSVLRSWRKKDASEKQSSTTPSSAEPSSGNVSENQGPVARVAPHNHYPKPPPVDIYRYPQQHGEYGVQNVSQIPVPVKYSEIIEPMQSIEQIPPILQKPKEKTYLEMCNVQQNHMKPPYPDYQNYKQHYDGLKNYNHVPAYKQQYHPYLQKESQMPSYVQKEANVPPQYLHNYKMSPSNYPRNYPREGNEFLANLNKIAPDMAQDIINDPHLRDPHLREPQFPMYPPAASMDQNRLYQQQHPRMYQRTSPIQHGVQNYGQRGIPQNFNQYPMNQQRMQPSDPYRMYPPHQRYGQVEPQMPPANISPRQYHENMMGFPSRISPNYPACGQLEYAQHYQHRQVPMRQDYLPIPNKPYIETHPEIPEIVPDESIHQPKKTLKAYLENWREEFTEEVESTEATAADKIQVVKSTVPNRENTLYVLDAMDIPSENIPQYLHLQPIEKLPPNIRAFTYNSEENVRQNALVISANVKADETSKNEIAAKHSGNTYQLFENKTDRGTDSLVYQSNIINPYKSEDISSHEDRPACKLLQSMVKARNANANERPLEKLDKNLSDKDKILRSCFQEPLRDVCRSLPQLIHEETEKLNKTSEEHLENDYSKIVDSILEEKTLNVHVMPVVHSARDISDNTEKRKATVKDKNHITRMTTNINDNASLNFAENLIKSLEVVERKSVIAENTLPHIVPENNHVELHSSYLFSMPEEHLENLTTTSGVNIKSDGEERATTKITYGLENKRQPKDLLALEDPIDLSHHLEDMDHAVKRTILETGEKTEENLPSSAEQKHVQNDLFEYKNLEKHSNVSVTDDEESNHGSEESSFETGHKTDEETEEDMQNSSEQKHSPTDISVYKNLAKQSDQYITDDEEINLSAEGVKFETTDKTNEKAGEEIRNTAEQMRAQTDIFEYKNIAKQSNNSITDDEEMNRDVEKSRLERDYEINEKTGEDMISCTDTFDYKNLAKQANDSISDETKSVEDIITPEEESTSCSSNEKEENIIQKTASETSELDESGSQEQIVNNLVSENEKILTENSGNVEHERIRSQDITVDDVHEDIDENPELPRLQDRIKDNEFEEKCEESSNHDSIKLMPQDTSDNEVQVSNSEDVHVPKEDIVQSENEITPEDETKITENKDEIIEEMLHQDADNCEENTEIENNGKIMEEMIHQNAEKCEGNKEGDAKTENNGVIMEEMIHQNAENCEGNKEEDRKTENNGEIMEEMIHQNAENSDGKKEEDPKSVCSVDDIVDNDLQDECSSLNNERQSKTECDVCDNNENVDKMQEDLCNVEERTCNINEDHNETITYMDSTTSDTIVSSQDVDETIENNLNQESMITTLSEEEKRSESINNIFDETDEEDVVDYTDEAVNYTSVSIDQGIINRDDGVANATKKDDEEIAATSEVSSSENAHFEDNINESKEAESIEGENEDFRNNLSEVIPDSELPVEIFEDREEVTSNPNTHLSGKEENNNEIIKDTILKNNHDNEVIENQDIEENNESLKARVLNVSSINEIVVGSYKLNETTSVQLVETNQGSIEEGNVTKEEIGSSFVLEIAKELLQIHVSEDSNGEKIISITPLTKVKVITPLEETKENTDKREEIPDKIIDSDIINNKDQLKNQGEVENETNTVEEIEINHDEVVYESEIEEVSETVLTTEEIDEPEQNFITMNEIEEKQDVVEDEDTEETCNTSNHIDDIEHPVDDEEITAQSEILEEKQDVAEEETEETCKTSNHIDDIEHPVEDEEVTAQSEILEEKQDIVEEETEETCNTSNHIDDIEHPVEDEEITAQSEILEEKQDIVEEETEETCNTSNHIDDIEHPVEDEEITAQSEILEEKQDIIEEETEETCNTSNHIDDIEHPVDDEEIRAQSEILEEKQDIVEEETEETCNTSNHIHDIEHPVDDEEIRAQSEILVETCNEVEAVRLNIEDYGNDQEIPQVDIIPANDLDLHNEIIIEHKEETHDEIFLENAQTEVLSFQTEEIHENVEECTKIQEEERIINNNYMEYIPRIESHKIKSKEQREKHKKQTNKVYQLQNPSKKIIKRINEKNIDNKKSQLNALRNFRKTKNRNATISELNQQRLAYLNSKKKKSCVPKIIKFESSFDSAERAKIFSSVVVIDKIPLETIKMVTERSVIEEKDNNLKEKYKQDIKRHTKIKLKDDKLSKEYKNIKTKCKRQREIARDIKRSKQKQKSSKPDDRKHDKTNTKKDDNATITTTIKNADIEDHLKTKNNNLTLNELGELSISNDAILDGRSTPQKSDNNLSTMSVITSNKLASDLNRTEKQIISHPLRSSENLEAKVEEKKLVDNQKINKEKSISELTILDNSVSGTKTRNESTINDEIVKGVPNNLKIPPILYPNQYTINSRLEPKVTSLSASDNFQVPLSKNIQNSSKKHSKDLRRSKSENHFNSDYLHNCKKRRLSLEEYNNRKRNLNKLTQKKIESDTKSNMPTSTVEDNKHKQTMVEEVLKSLNSEVMEDGDTKEYCSKEISVQKDLTLECIEPTSTLTNNTTIELENNLSESVSKNSEPIGEKTPNENIVKCSIVKTSIKVEHPARCEPLSISLSIENIEHLNPKDITLNKINNYPNMEDVKVESAKDSSQKVPSIEHNPDVSSNMMLPIEEEIQCNSDKILIEAGTSNCQLTDSNNIPLETPKTDDNSKKESETYSRAKEHFDKASIEEKLNSLEEFLPKIAPKDLAGVEISRKLEEILEENPITFDQKHYEMLLIRRFLNREILTQEELKRVRQIVQYKRAFQSMKKATPTNIPKRRYSSEFSKSIKIDFSDFDLKKSDPTPAVQKEEPVQRRICYNRSISAFVEAESRKNEMKNRRHSAKTSSESKFDWLNKEVVNRQSDFSKQPIQESSEDSLSIKPSVIVGNTSITPNTYKEKSTFLKSVSEDRISSNIIPFSSSPKSKPFNNSNLIESYRECKTFQIEPKVEFMDVDVRNSVLRKCAHTPSLELVKKDDEVHKISSGISENTSINNDIIEIDLTEEVSPESTSPTTNKLEQIYLEVPLNVINDKDKTEHLTIQDWVTEEVVKSQDEITKPLPNSLTENTSNHPTKNPISSNYIKHNILSIISKDSDKQRVATLESPRRNQILDESKEVMPKITLPTQTIKHTIQNLISHDHSSTKKYSSNIPQSEEQVSKVICTSPKSNKYIIPESISKKELYKEHLSNITVETSVTERPSKDTNHINSSTNSDENHTKSLNLEIHKILSPKPTKYISPSRASISCQPVNEIIINPITSTTSKIDKRSETVALDIKEKSTSSQITPIKNIKEASPCKAVEERQKKISNLEGSSLPKSEKTGSKNVLCNENKKRTFEQSPIKKTSDVSKEKSSKIKKFEKNQQEIASLEKSVSNLTIDKDCKRYPKYTQTNVNLEKPPLTSIFTKKEHETIHANTSPVKIKTFIGNGSSSKNDMKTRFEKSLYPEKKLEESPKKAPVEKNIKHSGIMPITNTKQITANKECTPSSSGSMPSCAISKNTVKEASCQNSPNKMVSKTKAQLKSFQDTIDIKSRNEDDRIPNNINISPVISSITKLTALLTYYKKGLESGGDISNLKKIKEIIDKVSPNLKNLPSVPDVNVPNEYAVSKPEAENSKIKLHLKKVHGENKKKKKRFRNLYTENDSEEDGCADPKAKEAKMDENAIDYSVYQRKSPAGVPKLVIKRRKSDFKSGLQPYVKINRISSIESMAKKRKRTILVNQVFVDT